MGVLCTWVKLLTDLQILGCELHKNVSGGRAPSGPGNGRREGVGRDGKGKGGMGKEGRVSGWYVEGGLDLDIYLRAPSSYSYATVVEAYGHLLKRETNVTKRLISS